VWSSNAETHSSCAILPTDRPTRPATATFVPNFPALEARELSDADPALWPFAIYFVAVLMLVATMLGLSWLLGQRRANHATNLPFESGVLSVGSPQIHMSVEFYLVAIFFVIFDLETVFIFAWAVAFFELGWEGFIAVAVFIAILAVALVYELSTGALDWGIKTRRGVPDKHQHPEEAH